MTRDAWNPDFGYGSVDDDVTLGDPYLAGVKRGVRKLQTALIVLTMIAVAAVALWAALSFVAPKVGADTVTATCEPGAVGTYTGDTGAGQTITFTCGATAAQSE